MANDFMVHPLVLPATKAYRRRYERPVNEIMTAPEHFGPQQPPSLSCGTTGHHRHQGDGLLWKK
jgi:hypothetical protein